MTCKNRDVVSYVLYVFSAAVFVCQCIWSVIGISPFERIGMFLLTAVLLHIASVIKVSGSQENMAQKLMKRTYGIMFSMYLMLFIALVFIDGYFAEDIRTGVSQEVGSFRDYLDNSVSFVPFKTTSNLLYGVSMNWVSPGKPLLNVGGNLLLCVPFALFLPLFFKKQHNFFLFFLTVTGISVLVEATQLLTRRGFCDIDDLIFNVSGACIAFGLIHIRSLRKLVQKIIKLEY